MTQLTDTQITSLFDFARSKYVRYIDVQHEIVDHLATDIELEIDENPTLSFDDALSNVYAKFPISGFSNYVRESEKAMNKFWGKIILNQFTKYGRLPLIIMFTILVLLQYQMILHWEKPALYLLIILALATSLFAPSKLKTIINSDDQKEDDKYLVVTIIKSWAFSFTLGPIYFAWFFNDIDHFLISENSFSYVTVLFSVMLSIGFISSAMVYFRFPEIIRSVLNDKYAHLKLSV